MIDKYLLASSFYRDITEMYDLINFHFYSFDTARNQEDKRRQILINLSRYRLNTGQKYQCSDFCHNLLTGNRYLKLKFICGLILSDAKIFKIDINLKSPRFHKINIPLNAFESLKA